MIVDFYSIKSSCTRTITQSSWSSNQNCAEIKDNASVDKAKIALLHNLEIKEKVRTLKRGIHQQISSTSTPQEAPHGEAFEIKEIRS